VSLDQLKYLSLTPEELKWFWRKGDKRCLKLVVYMLLLNAARVKKSREFKFSRRWHEVPGIDIDRRSVLWALEALEADGLIEATSDDRKSKRVKLL
jgi:hypothetical protein